MAWGAGGGVENSSLGIVTRDFESTTMNLAFAATWQWPQWVVIFLLFLSLSYNVVMHGKPRVRRGGPNAGQPFHYNAVIVMIRVVLWVFLLKAGGFF